MEDILWTLWPPSHVIMDTPDLDPAPGPVKLLANGIATLLHAH